MLWVTANNQLTINPKGGKMPSLESRPQVHQHLPEGSLGPRVEVNQRGLCIL